MSELTNTVAQGFIGSFLNLNRQLKELAAPLSEEQFWERPYSYGNSFGHLVLHLTGNLNYYIGTEIAGTGYIRDRDHEFNGEERPTKQETLERLDKTVEFIIATLHAQDDADWSKSYKAKLTSDFVKDRFSIFLRCATHFHHHVGQMVYLTKEHQLSTKP